MKLGDLCGQISINYLIFNGIGGALPPFPTTHKSALLSPIVRVNKKTTNLGVRGSNPFGRAIKINRLRNRHRSRK